ncbi:hypothetical protein [Moorena sp. SIO3I6]|uniref:hypothetical protein n=1 Tax=Moorena sp. SIO3I6 TaxID=2607831 RepID=UPI0013F89550|nr:hypothetical protein [Moorena sp. SIO3I6]NEP29538.1 hypothetical protein [Moorena sp. SIO3I6]
MSYLGFFPDSLLPAPCSLLPAPCSLLPAPCSLIRASHFFRDSKLEILSFIIIVVSCTGFFPDSRFPIPYSLLPTPYSLLPAP